MDNRDEICEISDDGEQIMHQWQVLVNQYMCTTDCWCYQGQDGDVRRKWESLGEEWFVKYNRTANAKMYFQDEKNEIPLYPLKWTVNETLAKKNFK